MPLDKLLPAGKTGSQYALECDEPDSGHVLPSTS